MTHLVSDCHGASVTKDKAETTEFPVCSKCHQPCYGIWNGLYSGGVPVDLKTEQMNDDEFHLMKQSREH